MAPPGIPKRATNQDNVFFSTEWSRSMDRQFISILLQLKATGYWTVGKKNERACARAIGEYNVICGTNFDVNFGLDRVRKLHKRYKVFTWVIQRPWVTYDATNHSVSCPDAVWKVLYDQQMLVAPYINEGEHSYDELRELFHVGEELNNENRDVIQISSDGDNDSSVVEIPNPYGSSLTETYNSGGSSFNTDEVFYNEIAWNYSDTDTEDSWKSNYGSTGMSVNNSSRQNRATVGDGRIRSSASASGKGQSSTASWSPFKKN